jgi:hypothetical protein
MQSQTGATMSMGRGGIYKMARKQKLNTTSSTEAEMVGADDVMPQMMWTRNFLLEQGVEVSRNILYQDNQSAMLWRKMAWLPAHAKQGTLIFDSSSLRVGSPPMS